jgi:hypothetical protein
LRPAGTASGVSWRPGFAGRDEIDVAYPTRRYFDNIHEGKKGSWAPQPVELNKHQLMQRSTGMKFLELMPRKMEQEETSTDRQLRWNWAPNFRNNKGSCHDPSNLHARFKEKSYSSANPKTHDVSVRISSTSCNVKTGPPKHQYLQAPLLRLLLSCGIPPR